MEAGFECEVHPDCKRKTPWCRLTCKEHIKHDCEKREDARQAAAQYFFDRDREFKAKALRREQHDDSGRRNKGRKTDT